MIWFTGDTHFGHKNVIEYAKRPYANVGEMDRELVNNWNSVVKPDDTVYHVGDVSFYRSITDTMLIRLTPKTVR